MEIKEQFIAFLQYYTNIWIILPRMKYVPSRWAGSARPLVALLCKELPLLRQP